MKLIALDLETTGLNPQTDQILEVGMVCFDSETGEVHGEFQTLVSHDRYEGSAYALQMNQEILLELTDTNMRYKTCYGESHMLEHEMLEFTKFTWGLDRPHVVGFNVAPFDLAFLKASGIDIFDFRAIELGTLLMGPMESATPVSSRYVVKMVRGPDAKVPHRALEDARLAVELYRWARENHRVLRESV